MEPYGRDRAFMPRAVRSAVMCVMIGGGAASAAPMLDAGETSIAPGARAVASMQRGAETITLPTEPLVRDEPSMGVSTKVLMAGPVRTMAALTIAAPEVMLVVPESPSPEEIEASASNDPARTNYRGEKVEATPVRYLEDFESGLIGPEWSAFSGTLSSEALSTFADPAGEDGIVLNIKTDTGSPYEIRLDVYLIPPVDAIEFAGRGVDPNEPSDNVFTVTVDGQTVLQLSPDGMRKLAGDRPKPGQPMARKIRIPFTSGHDIAEVRFRSISSDGAEGWSSWGIDNLVIDLGLQDPVFGVSAGDEPFEPGLIGMLDPGAGLTGEIPGLPGNRFAQNNSDFQGDGGGSPGGPEAPRRTSEDEVPAPGAVGLLVSLGFVGAARRRREIALRG